MTTPQYDATIPAVAHGGRFNPDPPSVDVIHSTEGPMSAGNARALAVNWFGRPQSEGGAGTSTTGIVDPVESVRMLDEHTIPYHVGPYGNPLSTGDEHCGSVNLTPEQWMSERGQAMLDRAAKVKAQRAIARGWSLADCRWLSLTEVARRTVRGFCTHNDVRLALGGTTHTDPGRNFPYTWYMGRIRYWYQVLTGTIAPEGENGMGAWSEADSANLKKTADMLTTILVQGFRADDAQGNPAPTVVNDSIRGVNNQMMTLNSGLSVLRNDVAGLRADIAALPNAIGAAVAAALTAQAPAAPPVGPAAGPSAGPSVGPPAGPAS